METLSFEQMECIEGGKRDQAACERACAAFTLSCLGIIGTGGWGALIAGASLGLSYYEMTTTC